MKNKPVLLMDVDEVVADFIGHYLKIANFHIYKQFTRDQVNDWVIEDALGLSRLETEIIRKEMGKPGVAKTLALFPMSREAYRELIEKFDVVFVTAPLKDSETWERDRKWWLDMHFWIDGPPKQICTQWKQYIDGEWFIDDKPQNVIDWVEFKPERKGRAILWDRPHNRKFEHSGVRRARDWAEVFEIVGLNEKKL